jgi:hypothetical protein
VREARAEISGGIDRVSGRAAETQTHTHTSTPQNQGLKPGASPAGANSLLPKTESDYH